MIKIWICIVAAVLISAGVFCDEDTIGNPDYCQDYGIKLEKDKEILSVPGECIKAVCVNPFINEIVYTKCPKLQDSPVCNKIDSDTSKPFPECCPTNVCKE